MRPQYGCNRLKSGQVQVNAVVVVAGDDNPSFAVRVPLLRLHGGEISVHHGRILTRQMADRHALDLDADSSPVMRIVMLSNKPGTDWQAVFPAARIASSRYRLPSANLR